MPQYLVMEMKEGSQNTPPMIIAFHKACTLALAHTVPDAIAIRENMIPTAVPETSKRKISVTATESMIIITCAAANKIDGARIATVLFNSLSSPRSIRPRKMNSSQKPATNPAGIRVLKSAGKNVV